ncbi:MAG: L-2-amino-thiazoline-4-carboxylic acid hydrolase [Deltaproteobacteria bacterium]|nr:L-2-amino-thiazoline-4-carboxylic acid hydrolase [Deltaproteobacteria bacterium]
MRQTILMRLLHHSRDYVVSLSGEDMFNRIASDAHERNAVLKNGAPVFRRSINRDNFRFATAALALYQSLQETGGLSQQKALDIMHLAIPEAVVSLLAESWPKRMALGWLAKSKLMAASSARAFAALNEPDGWLATIPVTDAHWAFDVHQCGLMIYLKSHDALPLCSAFCQSDVAAASLMKGLRFERTQTLSAKGTCCDFRYYHKK